MNRREVIRWTDPFAESKLLRRSRKIHNERMRKYRSLPVLNRVWWVELSIVQASESDFSGRDSASTLTFTPQGFWLRSRRKAKAYVDADHRAGGSGSMYAVEYRRCAVCGRTLLGPEATAYRERQRGLARLWAYPDQGPQCNLECKPHGRGQDGQRVTYRKDKAA
jgi:hypothetical protein